MTITEAAQRGIDRFGVEFRDSIDLRSILEPLLGDAIEPLGPMDLNDIKDEVATRTRALGRQGDDEMRDQLDDAACALERAENTAEDVTLKINQLFARLDYFRIKVRR